MIHIVKIAAEYTSSTVKAGKINISEMPSVQTC